MDELFNFRHNGIKGQQWGIRPYNKLTDETEIEDYLKTSDVEDEDDFFDDIFDELL